MSKGKAEGPVTAQAMAVMSQSQLLEAGAFLMAELTSSVTQLQGQVHAQGSSIDTTVADMAWRAGAWSGLALVRSTAVVLPNSTTLLPMAVALKEGESDTHDHDFTAWVKRWAGLNGNREQLYEAFAEAWAAGANARRKR